MSDEVVKNGANNTTTAAPAAAPAAPPSNPQADEIRRQIDEEKKKIHQLIDGIKRNRHRLAYKLSEQAAIAKLPQAPKAHHGEIGYLKRRKEAIEFRIATEAFSLQAEKDLIRKKGEIEEQLNEALKSYRIRKKAEYISNDIKEITKAISDIEAEIDEVDKRLDVLYAALRKVISQSHRRPRQDRKIPEPKPQEISLADIAIIKDNTNPKRAGNEDGE